MVQFDGMGLAIGPPAPARGTMGLAWVRPRMRLVRAMRRRMVTLGGRGYECCSGFGFCVASGFEVGLRWRYEEVVLSISSKKAVAI